MAGVNEFLILHVLEQEPVFQGEVKVKQVLCRVKDIFMIEEILSGGSRIRFYDGSELEVADDFESLCSLLGA